MDIKALPVGLLELASSFNEDANVTTCGISHIMSRGGNGIELKKVTTKDLQSILKVALGKVSSQDYKGKLEIDNFDKESILRFRSKCNNTKLRRVLY